ncbi:hypothetical protein LMG23994_00967 [Cupriavidus pinatubonensis]|uniref:Uncharacterized protein n=1 Tax=Cupriavidus pinatubonensis TaxID=248026 RepID=A0ABN7Y337_9BURK|nr:hypothetical protein LMG23994_00967 [Cupriavidus pinatubonensis]
MVLPKSLEGSRQLSALPGAPYKERLCGETVIFCTKRTTTPNLGRRPRPRAGSWRNCGLNSPPSSSGRAGDPRPGRSQGRRIARRTGGGASRGPRRGGGARRAALSWKRRPRRWPIDSRWQSRRNARRRASRTSAAAGGLLPQRRGTAMGPDRRDARLAAAGGQCGVECGVFPGRVVPSQLYQLQQRIGLAHRTLVIANSP